MLRTLYNINMKTHCTAYGDDSYMPTYHHVLRKALELARRNELGCFTLVYRSRMEPDQRGDGLVSTIKL